MGNRNTKVIKKPDKAAEKARIERENKIFHRIVISVFALIIILGFAVMATLPKNAEGSENSEQVQDMTVNPNGNIVLEEHEHDHTHEEVPESEVSVELVEDESESNTSNEEVESNDSETGNNEESKEAEEDVDEEQKENVEESTETTNTEE